MVVSKYEQKSPSSNKMDNQGTGEYLLGRYIQFIFTVLKESITYNVEMMGSMLRRFQCLGGSV